MTDLFGPYPADDRVRFVKKAVRRLLIIKNPKDVEPNMFGGKTNIFVMDFNAKNVKIGSENLAMDFTIRQDMAKLFFSLHPKGYRAVWFIDEETISYQPIKPEDLR